MWEGEVEKEKGSLKTGEEEESDPPSNEDSIEEFTSIEDSGKESSLCDISGVSAFQRESISTSSTDWMGPGPMPMDDSVEVFLAKRINEADVVNISTDSSVLDVSKGQTSIVTEMEI